MDNVEVLFQDAFCVAVNKPSAVVVHRGWANDRVTMMSLVRDFAGRWVYPVHRLDRGTSGVLLFAFDSGTAERLQTAFATGSVIKNYLALTRGITKELGLIDHAIAKSKAHEKRPAQTALRRIGSFERYSLVELRPFTGRQHQIRRHLKHIAHPLIGDTRYGKGEHNRRFRSEFELRRLALHASKLAFAHPESGQRVEVSAPLTADLLSCFEQLGLADAGRDACCGALWAPVMAELPVLASD